MKKTINYFMAGVSAIAALALWGSCSKSSSLPPIGGYNSSNDIAPTNLIAYWSMDGNATESKQNLSGTNTGGTFVAGQKGQAWQGAGNSYINYGSAGTALTAINSYTLSMWFNEPAQPVNNPGASYVAGQGAQGVFFMYDNAATGTAWNLLHLDFEPYTPKSLDSVRIHAGFNNTGSTGWQGIVPQGFFTNAIKKWVHLVMTYDASSSTYVLYEDGVPVGAQTAWTSGGYATPDPIYNGPLPVAAGGTQPMGSISFKHAARGLIIGAFPQVLSLSGSDIGGPQPWSGNFQGAVDEIRVYNKALGAADVGSLYQLELAKR